MPKALWMWLAAVILPLGGTVALADRADNRVYVQSGPDGIFYARCTPTTREGRAGRTEIYRVHQTGDTLLDRYGWYTPAGIALGWSPTRGKVAVLAIIAEELPDDWKRQEELRFLLGGEHLASYTTADLLAMGAEEQISKPGGRRAAYRVLGCEQVPGTNEYDFLVEIGKETTLRFDMTTGQVRSPRDSRRSPEGIRPRTAQAAAVMAESVVER